MIDERRSHLYCRDDLSKIENYDKAIADTTQIWDCHHRDEIRELPSGMIAYRSMQELIENGRYFQCPANELIFLTHADHARLHNKDKIITKETRRKISESNKGQTRTAETRRNLSESHKGKSLTEETKAKMSAARKGHTVSADTRKKISESQKGRIFSIEQRQKMSEAAKARQARRRALLNQ